MMQDITNKSNLILSICIPTYNRVGLLKESINAIIEQKNTFDINNIEIVISDNASTDGTKEYFWRYKPTSDGAPTTNVVDQYAGPMLLEKALIGGDPENNSLVVPGEIKPDGGRAVSEADAKANTDYKDK